RWSCPTPTPAPPRNSARSPTPSAPEAAAWQARPWASPRSVVNRLFSLQERPTSLAWRLAVFMAGPAHFARLAARYVTVPGASAASLRDQSGEARLRRRLTALVTRSRAWLMPVAEEVSALSPARASWTVLRRHAALCEGLQRRMHTPE